MSLLQPTEPIEIMKQKAALRALECVRPGMKLGLGTGSTARYFVDGLGQKCADGLEVDGPSAMVTGCTRPAQKRALPRS